MNYTMGFPVFMSACYYGGKSLDEKVYILELPDPRALPYTGNPSNVSPLPPIKLHLLHKVAAKIWVATNKYKRGPSAAHPCQQSGSETSASSCLPKLVPHPKVSNGLLCLRLCHSVPVLVCV